MDVITNQKKNHIVVFGAYGDKLHDGSVDVLDVVENLFQ
jgi:hypothetical protein